MSLFDLPSASVQSGKSNEWYTPAKYIEAARAVMGSIDLDPASCIIANQTIRAKSYYTQEENGLNLPWWGNVYLNPPFGRINGSGESVIKRFTTRLLEEYKSGRVQQAILLSTVQPNAAWFPPLWDYPICFFHGRMHFNKIIGGRLVKESRDSHMLGTIFVYMGPHEQCFIDIFSQFGTIARRVSDSRRQITPLTLWEVNNAS